MELRAGDRVDRYEVEGLVDESGVSAMYRVRHRELRSAHLLEVPTVRSGRARSSLREAWQALARLQHARVARVTDLIDLDGVPAAVFQDLDGPDLVRWTQAERPTLDELGRVGAELLAGVEAAHGQGLLHLDLRPVCVRMVREVDRVVPCILGFGRVQAAGDAGRAGSALFGSAARGSSVYLAPEQVRGTSAPDERADVFALGAVLYEMISGQPAFAGSDRLATLNRLSRGVHRPIRTLCPRVPDGVERALLGALVPDPDSRIPDVSTLAQVWSGALVDWQLARLERARRLAEEELGREDPPALAIAPTLLRRPALPSEAPAPAPAAVPAPAQAPPAARRLRPVAAPVAAPSSIELSWRQRSPLPLILGATALVLTVGLFWASGRPEPVSVLPQRSPPPVRPAAELTRAGTDEPVAAAAAPDQPQAALPVQDGGQSEAAAPPRPSSTPARPAAPANSTAPAPTPTPAPAPAPPPAPEAAPDAAATPPAPSPWDQPTTASIAAEGGVRLWLVGGGGRFPVGEVPPGTYTIKAFFDPMESTDAGTVTAQAGQSWTVACSRAMAVCSVQRR